MDLQHFDIAYYAGHKALGELRRAHLLYVTPFAEVFRAHGIQVVSVDFKTESDIATLSSQRTVQNINIEDVDPINAFHWSSYLDILMKREAEYCINAAIFFQVMMESVINDALGSSAAGSFRSKWDTFLTANGASPSDRAQFDQYFSNVYRALRNKVVHPAARTGVLDASIFRFPYAHENLRCGWHAFVFLLNKTQTLSLDYTSNWREMAETIHAVPADIVHTDYCNMGELAGRLMKKHLDHFNSIVNANS